MLEIVEQQQDPRRLEVFVQAVKERPITGITQSYALRDRGQHQIRIPDRGQGHEIRAIRAAARDLRGQLEAEPRLAAAARAGESQQAAVFQELLQVPELTSPADEASQLARQAQPRRGHAVIITPGGIPGDRPRTVARSPTTLLTRALLGSPESAA